MPSWKQHTPPPLLPTAPNTINNPPEPLTHCERDSHDTRAANYVTVSKGPPQDPQYSNSLLRNPINGIHHKDLKNTKLKPRTGYSKNLAANVKYDKNVDESADFHTTQKLSRKSKAGITPMVPSGFCRLPLFNVTQDGSSKFNKDKQTLMKACFTDGKLKFKETQVNKQFILPSATAYISDAGEISSLGNPEVVSEAERFAYIIPRPWECPRPDMIRPDGFTRSTRPKDPLQTDYEGMPEIDTRLLQPKIMEKIKHTDLAEWVHRKDLKAIDSFAKNVHPPMDLSASLKAAKEAPSIIGWKEATGGVQNNDQFIFHPEPNPDERFLTETSKRFLTPPLKSPTDPKCNILFKSGFSDGNRYRYVNKAPSDAQTYSELHPTIARYTWLNERGLHTAVPNKTHLGYKLNISSF
ncbi:hypothetical protein BCR33DRAFT_712441 [Rhizoclosmatium globosum]|uniref:Uncharacterized protein n=1 Tax=Rhizoclosmatium globosum TaxID=329046 RepID=A0A1Y2CWF5_9FUNG|nr:hypothetical protein BCR33DRAFT_712441 [Rhizoclosmatium globosum]|eukprot:ORY51363.1 hypothetical protein BCR33DRAFT_712441 [Rhizoclosmatium globosum]